MFLHLTMKLKSVMFTIFIFATSLPYSSATKNAYSDEEKIIFFPNPDGLGGTVEAHLYPPLDAKVANVDDVHFFLYTKNNPTVPDELFLDDTLSVRNSNFHRGAQLNILVHGFTGHYTNPFPSHLKDAYLDMDEKINIILVDWSLLVQAPDYFSAVHHTKLASQFLADFLKFLITENYANLNNTHLVGFSLGGQLVGQVGHHLRPEKLARITGLDPAYPLFADVYDEDKLTKDDAEFVDVVHTTAGILGYPGHIGHVDWYPNGGRVQPGCGFDLLGVCAHSRATKYFMESVLSNTGFYGKRCHSYSDFIHHRCHDIDVLLGEGISPSTMEGQYYSRTNTHGPFANGHN